MADRDEQEIRPEVFAQDTINTGFHAGPHPQRPIPPDLNEAEQDALAIEKRSLSHHRPGTPVPTARGANQPTAATVPVDPDRPEQGVLYTGPSAAEDLALRTGRSVDEAQAILDAPGKRAEAAQAEQQQARETRRRASTEGARPAPSAPRKADGE